MKSQTLIERTYEITGDCYCEVTIRAEIGEDDKKNDLPIAVCNFAFASGGRLVRADDGLMTKYVPANPYVGYEYVFSDTAVLEGNVCKWVFQVRAPSCADRLQLEIKTWKNLSPVEIKDVGFRLMSHLPVVVTKSFPARRRFRVNGQDNVLVCSGIAHVAAMNQLPHPKSDGQMPNMMVTVEAWIVGAKRAVERRLVSIADTSGRINELFSLPQGTIGGEVMMEIDGEASMVDVDGLAVYTRFRPVDFGIVPGMNAVAGNWSMRVRSRERLHVSGHIRNLDDGNRNPKAAIVTVAFRGANGCELPCKELGTSKLYGPYFYTASSDVGESFDRDFIAPPGAECVCFEMRAWCKQNRLQLCDFSVQKRIRKPWNPMCREFGGKVPPDGMLARPDVVHRCLVEWLGSEEELDRLRMRKDTPIVQTMNYNWILGKGWRPEGDLSRLRLNGFPEFNVSPQMTWLEDPFKSKSWLLKFTTGMWIPFLGANLPVDDYYLHCKAYWSSFFQNNTYPNRYSTQIYNDHAVSARIEALLLTMYGTAIRDDVTCTLRSLQNLLSDDPVFFEQMLFQLYTDVELIDYFLRCGRYVLHNHNLIMAKALLTFANCFSDFHIAKWYRDTAFDVITSHVREMFEPDGFIREQSAYYQHSFTKIFLRTFAEMHDSLPNDFRGEMSERLRKMVLADALVCPPDGLVLPIGDTARAELRDGLRASVKNVFDQIGECFDVYPSTFADCPRSSVFKESGLYVFRNPDEGRMLFVDLSTVLKVHGHYDMGNWLYYSNGTWWVSDLGGPWRYGTKEYRQYLKSDSHNVFQPQGRGQALGEAYDVELSETPEWYILSCKTNVYGPDFDVTLRYCILKDLSAVAVQTVFVGNGQFFGRLHFGAGVNAKELSDSSGHKQWRLSNGQEKALLAIVTKGGEEKLDTVMSAPCGIELIPVDRLTYFTEAQDGHCESIAAIGTSTQALDFVISRFQDVQRRA